MLLHELTGVKHLHQLSWSDILTKLEEKGIKIVGTGKYGQVLTHPSWDYVIKIFENDPYYMGFVNWAIAHPNKHFPKFAKKPLRMHKFHTRDRKETPHWYMVKIEKLYPITDKALMEFLVRELEHCAEAAWRKHNNHKYQHGNPNYVMRFPDGQMIKGADWDDVFKKFPWTEELGLAYSSMWEAELGTPDIHSGNVMQRKDGTVVIIDPVWQGETPYQAYDAWYRSEFGSPYDDPDYGKPPISGPNYKNKPPPKQPRIWPQRANPEDDDIPF